MNSYILRRLNIGLASIVMVAMLVSVSGAVLASTTTSFTQVINPGVLSTDIVDGSYASVGSPSVAMTPLTFAFACQTSTGYFGTTTPSVQQIYVKNPDAADNGWVLSVAAADPTNLWTGTGATFDFNDATGSGCDDGADADSRGGQMTIDASSGTLENGACTSCTSVTTGITKGSAQSFVEGSVNSITLLTAANTSNDIGDWVFKGINITQKIPKEQPAAADYSLNLVLSIVTS